MFLYAHCFFKQDPGISFLIMEMRIEELFAFCAFKLNMNERKSRGF